MLPTRPRSSVRSRWSSCTAPFSTTATRVSWGAQLMRMSCMGALVVAAPSEPDARLSQQLGRFVQGQSHDTGVTAVDAAYPAGHRALDRVRAGLAEWLAARDVGVDPGRRQRRHVDARHVDEQ